MGILAQRKALSLDIKNISISFIFKKDVVAKKSLPLYFYKILVNQGIDDMDLLVFISFQMPNLRKLILSGNKLTGKGVVYLSKKRFEGVTELMMADNNICTDLITL